MKGKMAVFICLATCAAVHVSSAGTMILTPEDGRVWQTVFDAASPLSWRWEESAATATLTVSNLLRKTHASEVVARAENAAYGSYALGYAAGAVPCGEALYDVVLVQRDASDNVVDTQTARLARLPAAFAVETSNRLARLESPRPVAYDAGWAKSTEGAEHASYTFTPAGGLSATESLAGVGGYFPVDDVAGRLAVDFDDMANVWAADIVPKGRLLLILR